jgi:DNA-directed RNA polymerase I, II, and III subunit RPABC2
MVYIIILINVFICRVVDDFDDVDDEDNLELEPQEDEAENIELLNSNEAGGGVQRSKRITTRYMTKYIFLL